MRYKTPSALEMAVKAAAKASPLDTSLAVSAFYYYRLQAGAGGAPASNPHR